MLDRSRLPSVAVLVGLTLALAVPAPAQQDRAGRERQEQRREEWQKVPDILQALGAAPGAVVADVGAGGGFFTVRLARAVGPTGRVYAVDVNARMLDRLRERLAEEAVTNVEVVEGASDDPRLPAGALDAALIVNAYHEMTAYRSMLEKIRAALKPDGRLVIVEPISASRREATRERQVDSHEIGAEHVAAEARAAGFRVARLEDPFVPRRESRDDEWLMVLRPAAATPPAADAQTVANDAWKGPELRIDVESFKRLVADGNVLVIDVRDPDSYRDGHLPGAILMTPDTLEARAAELRAETRPIVTYCS
jgi:precorrin-6B methylase 2